MPLSLMPPATLPSVERKHVEVSDRSGSQTIWSNKYNSACHSVLCNNQELDLLPEILYDEFIVSEMLHKQAINSGQYDFERFGILLKEH